MIAPPEAELAPAWPDLAVKGIIRRGTENIALYLTGLALVFMAMTFVVFVFDGAFAASERQYVIDRPNVMRGIKGLFAGSFGLLGLRLAFTER